MKRFLIIYTGKFKAGQYVSARNKREATKKARSMKEPEFYDYSYYDKLKISKTIELYEEDEE